MDIKKIDSGKINKENDTYTQFQKCCNNLGVEIIITSIPQAKSRIERLFGTLQSRLISELRLNKIKTLEEGNQFLKTYINVFNKQWMGYILLDTNYVDKWTNLLKERNDNYGQY